MKNLPFLYMYIACSHIQSKKVVNLRLIIILPVLMINVMHMMKS